MLANLIKDKTNLGHSKNIVRKPFVTNHKIRSLSKNKLQAIKEIKDKCYENRTMPESYYSLKQLDIAWIDAKI